MFRKTIPDETWSRLAPVLHAMGMHGIRELRDRIEAMLWRMRTGSPWRYLPTELGSWSTNFNFFNRWSKRGAWRKVFEALRGELDDEWNFIDSTSVKVHADAHGAVGRDKAAQAIGKSRGGWTSKLHVRCDAHGNLIEVIATGGNVSDFTAAPALIENCCAEYLIADKGYDSNKVRDTANARGICDQIPTRTCTTRSNRHFDVDLYRLRHIVENFFCRIKRHRAIATRYDKLVRNFLSFVYLAAAWEALK
jgi:transposase